MTRISLTLLVLGLFALAGATRGAPGQRRGRALLQTDTAAAAAGGSTDSTQPEGSNSSTGSLAGTIANATSTDSLFEALLRPSVTTIRVLGELMVDPARARAVVTASLGAQADALNLTRDVTIVGVAVNTSIATVDFHFTARLIRIARGATLNFQRIRVRGLFERLDAAPILFTNESSGAVRFTNTILQRTACLPPSQQLVDLINANKAGGAGGTGGGNGDFGAATLTGGAAPTTSIAADTGKSTDSSATSSGANTLDIAPAYVYDQPFCVSTLTDVGLDPLAVDDCFSGPLVLQEITITVSSSTDGKRDPTTGTSPDPGLPGTEGGNPGGVGGGSGDGSLLPPGAAAQPSLTLGFNNTMILCEVFVGPTCAQQTGEALVACIRELLDRRNARMPSPPPASSPPPAGRSPAPSPSPSPVPPVQSPGPSSPSGVPLVPVLVPALVGSVVLAAVVLGGIVFWRRRQRRGSGGAYAGVKSGLDSLDSDAQQVLALQVNDGGGGGGGAGAGGGGGKGGGGAAAAATGKGVASSGGATMAGKGKPPASTAGYGSDTNTLGSGTASGLTSNLTYGSSTMTMSMAGLTASPGASPPDSANTDPTKSIVLHHMLGAGSFGRVYYGTWQGVGVAVKIIPHSEQANAKVQQEVALCIKFNHPNVVRSLHCVTFEASEQQQLAHMQDSLRSASTLAAAGAAAGGGGLGAGAGAGLGVGAHGAQQVVHVLNMETWIVLEYCNAGSLASRLNMKAAVMGTSGLGLLGGASLALAQDSGVSGAAVNTGAAGNSLTSPADSVALSTALQREQQKDAALAHMRGVLSVARDIAAGMAYLHALNVCHGDLKCENVLLCYKAGMDRASTGGAGASGSVRALTGAASASGPQAGAAAAALGGPSSASLQGGGQRDRVPFVAKVADFGLSKTFNEASTHMSTATVGTVTHMCPVLLLTGQMRPSCDVFSFGIMLWQMATGGVPFAGMRYAEIVYKVAVAGLRPEFPAHTPPRFVALAESCWAADPTARPTFEALVGRLGELLEVADELQAEHEAALMAARDSVARPEDVALAAATTSEADARVASQWAAAAAAALLE